MDYIDVYISVTFRSYSMFSDTDKSHDCEFLYFTDGVHWQYT